MWQVRGAKSSMAVPRRGSEWIMRDGSFPAAARAALAALLLGGGVAHAADASGPAAPVAAPPLAAGTVIPAAALRQDLAILRDAVTTLHPGLLRYLTQAEADAAYADLARELSRDRTLAEVFLALSTYVARLRCGHTQVSLFNQSPAVREALFQGGRLPFHFRWIGDRMVVTRGFGDDPLPRGTEVLEVDGVPAAAILARLLPLARGDGANDGQRRSHLEVQGRARWEAFDVLHPLVFPSADPRVTLRVTGPGGAPERTVRLRRLGAAEREATALTTPRGDEAPGWRLRVDAEGLAVLTMPTWALYNTTWDWKGSLRTTFQTIVDRGVTDLVIDLRENEGGLGVGDEILAHLVDAPVPLDDLERRVRYRQVPARLNPYLGTWDDAFRDWGMNAQPIDGRFYRQLLPADRRRGDVIRPIPPRFTGRVFVLVSPVNGSATHEFATHARRHGLATLVGEPLGGNERGINGGAFFFLRLPGSGLEVDLPVIGYFRAGDRPDAAPRPDVLAPPTVESIADGLDPALAAVEALRATAARTGGERAPTPPPPR
jgi:hypothetical protein